MFERLVLVVVVVVVVAPSGSRMCIHVLPNDKDAKDVCDVDESVDSKDDLVVAPRVGDVGVGEEAMAVPTAPLHEREDVGPDRTCAVADDRM